MKYRKIAATIAGTIAVLSASGCGTGSATFSGNEKPILHASRVKDYNNLAELKQDSVAIVQVTASRAEQKSLNDIPTTLTNVSVDEVLWGNLPERSLSIQQLGRMDMDLHDTGSLLENGKSYLLYVKPFHMSPGDNTGLHQITGGQGVYEFDAAKSEYRFIGGGTPDLPKRITANEAETRTW